MSYRDKRLYWAIALTVCVCISTTAQARIKNVGFDMFTFSTSDDGGGNGAFGGMVFDPAAAL